MPKYTIWQQWISQRTDLIGDCDDCDDNCNGRVSNLVGLEELFEGPELEEAFEYRARAYIAERTDLVARALEQILM